MSELKQILYPATDPTTPGWGGFGGYVAEEQTATATELHDGNDTTQSDVHGYDDTVQGPAGSIEFYCAMDTCIYAGAIDFVRWHMRSEHTETPGWNAVFDTILGHKNGFYSGSIVLGSGQVGEGYLDRTMDNATDPQTHLAWAAAAINAAQFGWRIDAEGMAAPCDGHVRVSEFWIEVWGPEPPPPPPAAPSSGRPSEYLRREIYRRTGREIPEASG